MMIRILSLLGGLLFCLTMTTNAKIQFHSGPQQVALLELYTSEGCSSCPPAEAWLSRLQEDPGLWKAFVPVSYHVDYWNRLGWKDRYSSSEWTERQRRYAALWSSESVYTPAVVLNGTEWRNWSSKTIPPNDKGTGQLRIWSDDGKRWEIEFQPEKGECGEWEAHLAFLGAGIASKIGAGENSGRNLIHDFVVLFQANEPMATRGGQASVSLTIPQLSEPAPRSAVASWVTRRGQLIPVQATGGWMH
jgi:hypothetical protein